MNVKRIAVLTKALKELRPGSPEQHAIILEKALKDAEPKYTAIAVTDMSGSLIDVHTFDGPCVGTQRMILGLGRHYGLGITIQPIDQEALNGYNQWKRRFRG